MISSDDNRYFGVLLEEIRDQNKAVLEAVGDMRHQVALIPGIQQDVAELKQDVKVIKAAVTDLSRQVADHDQQLQRLHSLKAA